MKRIILIPALLTLTAVVVFNQTRVGKADDKEMREIKQFESEWIIASLNRDGKWFDRFIAGKLLFVPVRDGVKAGTGEIGHMIDSAIANNPKRAQDIKVRVTGNISVLGGGESNSGGNMVAGNRAYYFLDTLNKRNGKWEIIATHFSRLPETESREDAGQTIRQLERELSAAKSQKDTDRIGRILADDFSGISESGEVFDKNQYLRNLELQDGKQVQSEAIEEMKIKIYGDTATVTYRRILTGSKTKNADLKSLVTNVWVKSNGGWQVVNEHATRIS